LRASVVAAVRRYRDRELEYPALRVVGRGLFLAVMLMVAFLYVFTRATDLIAGANEVIVPTVTVSPDLDIGALAQGAFTRTSAAVVSLVGMVTLIVSAGLTGHALRNGARRALLSDPTPTRLLSPGTALAAAALALVVFATWLLTLATALRHAAWIALLGREIPTVVVDIGKAGAVLLSLLLIGTAVAVVIRTTLGRLPRSGLVAATAVAVIVVLTNFFLLYTYVGALINPAVSAGIVLVLTLLVWVNVVTRAFLAALCWVTIRG
jgi:hypothetical protein